MPETYRDQWEAAAAILRSHAAQFDELARTAPPRPQAAINEQFLGGDA